MEAIAHIQDEQRRFIVEESLVSFFPEECYSFSHLPQQGFIESFQSTEEVTIRTISGEIISNIKINKVHL